MSFIDVNDNNATKEFNVNQDYDVLFEGSEINLVELKTGPPYVCQLLKPGEVKDKMYNKTYSFDVSKADNIFDILLKDKQIILSGDHKLSTTEQKKGKKYCKFHHTYGQWTNNCIHFRMLIKMDV